MKNGNREWSTLAAVKAALVKKWEKGDFLREAIEETGLFPYRVSLSGPSSSDLGEHFSDARAWVREIEGAADRSDSFAVEWREVNNRIIGQNRIPVALVFDELSALARFAGKARELDRYREVADFLLDSFPALKPWVLKHAFDAIDLRPAVERLVSVTRWIVVHPRPGIYLRQLCVPNVHTKFIETHRKTIGDWLDLLLDPSSIDRSATGIRGFEERFGFLTRPQLVRFRHLDAGTTTGGFSDLTVRADEFCATPMNAAAVFVTENDINGLSFPAVANGIVVFGRGYGFDFLSDAAWLRDREILYWGDIDTHGFAILSQFREYFPRTRSFLMDRRTLVSCRESWSVELAQHASVPANLTEEELGLFRDLREHAFGDAVRLEQELVPFDLVKAALEDSGGTA